MNLAVFDLDGTLVDTAPDLIDSTNIVLAAHGVPPVPAEILLPHIGIGVRRMMEVSLKEAGRTMSEAELERWVAAVSSHSIRVGVAQDNFAAGESLPAIMQAYRWRDPKTVMRYGAKLAAKSGASARLAKRFGGE